MWFIVLVGVVAVERVAELAWSRAHERRMAVRGGRVIQEPLYAAMVTLHAGTLVAAPLESLWRARSSRSAPRSIWPSRSRSRARSRSRSSGRAGAIVRGVALAALGGATLLRLGALRALGDSWSTRVTRFPDGARRVVTRGPYRRIRHPNYAAVILELAALPLVGGAWMTALVASAANALLLSRRIPFEERELARDPAWRAHFSSLPRFIPTRGHARATVDAPVGGEPA